MPIVNRIADFSKDMQGWRRHLHANPEPGFECHETAGFVIADQAAEMGAEDFSYILGHRPGAYLFLGQGDGPGVHHPADDDMGRVDHGTMFYKAVKEGLIDPKRSVQVGIRTSNSDTLGVNIIDAREVHLIGPQATATKIKAILGDYQTYLTFDIDCLDPAFAPGTGTPVWGGLSSAQASIILRDLAGINMVGGDVVEVSPPFDTGGATAIAGAHVAHELLCLWAWNERKKSK